MKKIAIALAVIASLQVANAQVKAPGVAKAAAETAQAAADNPKKATKFATWLKLGQAYVEAYDAPALNGWIGASKNDLQLVMGNNKPMSQEEVQFGGQTFIKEKYKSCDYYFKDGVLSIIDVTQPLFPDALDRALEAYKTAYKLDTKKSKTKDIAAAISNIAKKYSDNAYSLYTKGDFKNSSVGFEKAALASTTEPCATVDTNAFYNAGMTASFIEDYERAKVFFDKCINEYGYDGVDGEIFARLADIYEKTGEKGAIKDILEKGFTKYPQSQSILIGLINYYITSNEDTNRLFQLINDAKRNEPTNASLYYVEGNIHSQLGQEDEAVASYDKCAEINKDYEYGYIGKAVMFYNKAFDIREKAQNEMDNEKFNALADQFEQYLKKCIEPFEKAFEMTKDAGLKRNLAEYLKSACFTFREEDPKYQAAYDKYAEAAKQQ